MRRQCQLDLRWWSFHNIDKSQLSSPCRQEMDTTSCVNLTSTEIFNFKEEEEEQWASHTQTLISWGSEAGLNLKAPTGHELWSWPDEKAEKSLKYWPSGPPRPTSWHAAVRLGNAISPGLMLCLSTQQLLQDIAWWLAEGEWGAVRPMSCLILYPRRHTLWGQRDWCWNV